MAKIECFYNNNGVCENDDLRIFGMFRRACKFSSDDVRNCKSYKAILERYASFDSVRHGPAIDSDGREWEICKVTRDSVIIRIRDPFDSAVNEVAVSKEAILNDPTTVSK